MSMVTIKTADLIGPALDWAVCLAANGFSVLATSDYSTDWAQGGPLIEEYSVGVIPVDRSDIEQFMAMATGFQRYPKSFGPTHLVAACRAIVAAKLGDEVQVPAEIVQQ